MIENFLQIDFPAMLVAILAALSCSMVGSFLILRRQALMGDALSHIVLPGIVVGFILTGSLAALPMMAGALGASLLAVFLIGIIRRYGQVEPGATMGVVFTAMFAAGVLLLELKVGSRVHLDTHHALYGALELTYWQGLNRWSDFLQPGTYTTLPHQISLLFTVTVCLGVLTTLFYKELKLCSFDTSFASSLGFPVLRINAGLMAMAAVAAVAAFEAVGSILVIAMFICPPATARMLTDRLSTQILLSMLIGTCAAMMGYILATLLPYALGSENALNAAGMIAVTSGLFQLSAMLFSPRHGTVLAHKRKMRKTTIRAKI